MAQAEAEAVIRSQPVEAGLLVVAIVVEPGKCQEELVVVQPQALVMPLDQQLWPIQAVVEVAVVGRLAMAIPTLALGALVLSSSRGTSLPPSPNAHPTRAAASGQWGVCRRWGIIWLALLHGFRRVG